MKKKETAKNTGKTAGYNIDISDIEINDYMDRTVWFDDNQQVVILYDAQGNPLGTKMPRIGFL